MKVLNCETSRVACHSTGMISGRVVIVRGHLDLKNVHTGDIIVAKQTDVNYTPQMLIASAIITEEGGRFSHAATIARENHIPCLVGCVGVMAKLTNGDVVTIDTHNKLISVA